MRVRISNKVSVRVEKAQYVVERYRRKKTDDGYVDGYIDEKWYTDLESLIKYLIREKFSHSNEELMMSEFLRRYQKEFAELKQLLHA